MAFSTRLHFFLFRESFFFTIYKSSDFETAQQCPPHVLFKVTRDHGVKINVIIQPPVVLTQLQKKIVSSRSYEHVKQLAIPFYQ